MTSNVAIVKCPDYDPGRVLEAVRKSLDLLGGIIKFISPRSKVLVKPNLLMAIEPQAGVDTHPEVVRAVIKLLKGINCNVLVGDSPSTWNNRIEEVYQISGIKKICEEEEVELVKFERRRWRGKFPLSTYLDECDYLVSIPKFKTHELTILTAAIKNNFGLVSGTYKTELHRCNIDIYEFSKAVVDIYQEARPALSIVDGITAMEGDGPGTGGKLRQQGLIIAGADAVAVDSVLTMIMGLKPLDILTTRIAHERKLGVAGINSIKILGENIKDLNGGHFELPKNSLLLKIPQPLLRLAGKFIQLYPRIVQKNCVLCGTCIGICPQKAIRRDKEKIIIHYAKCISCFCCQESCPAAAIKVKKNLLVNILRL